MSIRQIIMLLGFFLIIQPFLGFTSTIDTTLNIVVGLLIIILAYNIFSVGKPNSMSYSNSNNNFGVPEKKEDLPFVEHKNFDTTNSNSVS